MHNVTVILNSFKRQQFLKEQIECINNQTIKPKEIMIWNNNPDIEIKIENTTTANSNKNFGVWARFAYALNAKTEYVCIFDDDTVPGNKWLENCHETIKNHEGLLGTIGLIFENTNSYYPHKRYGWDNNNEETQRVDIVGHCWFFKREWLPYFWMETPMEGFDLVGEDMHFSYILQKYLKLNTYVPPHPKGKKEMWGSIRGWDYGTAPHGISHNNNNLNNIVSYYKALQEKGFKIINQ